MWSKTAKETVQSNSYCNMINVSSLFRPTFVAFTREERAREIFPHTDVHSYKSSSLRKVRNLGGNPGKIRGNP